VFGVGGRDIVAPCVGAGGELGVGVVVGVLVEDEKTTEGE